MAVYGRYGADIEPLEDEEEDEGTQSVDREREYREELARRDAQIAATQARLDQMERDVSRRFAENKSSTPKADDMYQAQQELEISDEELLDPRTAPDAIRKIAEHQARKIAAESSGKYDSVVQNMARSTFESNMDRLSRNAEFYDELEPLMREYFQDNPDEMHVAGRVEEVYERLVGKNYSVLRDMKKSTRAELEQADDDGGESISRSKSRFRQQSRVVDAPVRTASPSGRAKSGKKKEVVLDDARERERQRWIGLGIEITPEEWVDIEQGRRYPKKYAADLQVGLGNPGGHDYESER